MINITTFQARVAPKLHGTTLAKLGGSFYDKMYEAAGNMLAMVKPHSVIRRVRIANALYDQVYTYALEDDCEVDNVIDIRPIGERSNQDEIEGTFSKEFDIKKPENSFAIEYVNGSKVLRVNKVLTPSTPLHRADSLTLEGTITASGDVTDLAIDDLDFLTGSGSIKFNLSGSTGQGILTFALPATIDLEDLEDLGAVFHWLKFPLSTALTSVRIRIGSSSGDYKEVTVTAAHDRAWESDAWMLLRYLMANASTTGTPDFGAIDYVQIAINYTSGTARNDVKIDNIMASLGRAFEIVYYSNRLFTDVTGVTWKEIPTASTDIIRLDGASANNAYLYETMLTLQQELKGKNMATDFAFFKKKLGNGNDGGLYDELQRANPDQRIVRSTEYHVFDDLAGD